MSVELTKTDFATTLHTPFQLHLTPKHTVALELVTLQEGNNSSQHGQFTLGFRGPLTAPFSQGTWLLAHQQIGQFALFLVPVRRDPQGMYYEAVFNRPLAN